MYKLVNKEQDAAIESVLLIENNIYVPCDPANSDYQAYLKWLEEGNTPEPADET
jgi:hypothetical protein